jgi:hypothetical protein
LGLAWLAAPVAARAQTEAAREYQVKAAFLFNFLQFVTWPSDTCPTSGGPFVIGVLGDDPFGSTLDRIVSGETVRNRPLVIERYDEVEEVGRCQILFISDSEEEGLDTILAALAGRSILTVGETEDFAERSGIIALALAESRVRLRINPAAAEAANLSISSQLLRLADVVRTGG